MSPAKKKLEDLSDLQLVRKIGRDMGKSERLKKELEAVNQRSELLNKDVLALDADVRAARFELEGRSRS